ncbi:MAG: transporter substrate-binding domain-containing protein [Phycisphaerales bacterium]|nr:transporter substrate-binding domain-containing protein [Phycisphaerales bacterium]
MAAGEGFSGIDIDLAENLAQSLGVDVAFVPTTWPTLLADFEAGKFDIGMSGISRTLNRARTAYFSNAYHSGGKAPIVRCGDVSKFRSLSDLNRPTTRVIVNPGGTNQKFADKNLYAAQISVFDDNTKIFQEIVRNRADVMVTDLIEVLYQAGRNPSLCRAMPGRTLTVSEKGFLMPQDDAWHHYVNAWLAEKTLDGTRDAIFRKYLAGVSSGFGG